MTNYPINESLIILYSFIVYGLNKLNFVHIKSLKSYSNK